MPIPELTLPSGRALSIPGEAVERMADEEVRAEPT